MAGAGFSQSAGWFLVPDSGVEEKPLLCKRCSAAPATEGILLVESRLLDFADLHTLTHTLRASNETKAYPTGLGVAIRRAGAGPVGPWRRGLGENLSKGLRPLRGPAARLRLAARRRPCELLWRHPLPRVLLLRPRLRPGRLSWP